MTLRHLKSLACIPALLAGLLLGGASLALAQGWAVQTLSTRILPDGQFAKIAIAVHQAASAATSTPPVRHVLVYPQPLGTPQLKVASGNTDLTMGGTWIRALLHLQLHGVSLVYVDIPSDAERRGLTSRPSREVRLDLAATIKEVPQLFPGSQMHLAGFSSVAPLLDIAGDLQGFNKIVLAGSALGHFRSKDWSDVPQPVLMFHAPSTQCDAAPFLEAEALAKRSRFTLVKVGYERQDSKVDCGRTSQHVLHGQEAAVAKVVADWLDGKDIPSVIGHASPQTAWREEITSYQVPSTFGSNQLEATLLLPDALRFGAGPYPVMVFNHGDVELDSAAIRSKSRIRDMVVAREFLQLGVAALMPARRGVGMSEGTYPKGFSANDGDSIYKARVHA